MSLKKYIGLVSFALIGGTLAFGCSSSSSNNNPSDAGTTTDSGKPKPVPSDDSGAASDDGGGGGSTCAPADESAFKPTWHAPRAATPSCTQAQIDAYHQCLKDGQTQQNPPSCAPFNSTNISTENKTCVTCILTQDSATQYGPIIVHKGTIEANVSGCIAVAENKLDGSGCGGMFQAASECTSQACTANCPVTDDASFAAFQNCETDAGNGTCKTYEDKASCADALVEAGGSGAKCLSGQTFDELYDNIVPIFCGGAVATGDGGTNG